MYTVGTTPATNKDEETQITEPTKPPLPIRKVALIIGSAVVVVIVVIVAIVLSQNLDSSLPTTNFPQPSQQPHVPEPTVGMEPGSLGILANTRLYPLVQLAKAHPLVSIGLLVGVILIAVAITLGVVLSRPSEPVIDQPIVTKDEQELGQGGKESVWKQYLGLWIALIVVGSIVLVILAIVLIFRNRPSPPPTKLSVEQSDLVEELKGLIDRVRTDQRTISISQSPKELFTAPTVKATNLNGDSPLLKGVKVLTTAKDNQGKLQTITSAADMNVYHISTGVDRYGLILTKPTAAGKVHVEKFDPNELYQYDYLDLGNVIRNPAIPWDALKRLRNSINDEFFHEP